jgi:DNA-binding GntR family transcriptional regulator
MYPLVLTVVDAAYDQIRALVLSGDLAPGARLGQVELAERFGISRTPIREALRRLSGEGLVDFHPNRGFRVADLGLDAVLRRLEVRAIVEPGIARLAAQRRTAEDLKALRQAIARETNARSAGAAHDASRDFHVALARATHNDELVRTLDSLWLVEVGRRLLSRRSASEQWVAADVEDHQAIAEAVERHEADRAAALMSSHIGEALQHWQNV